MYTSFNQRIKNVKQKITQKNDLKNCIPFIHQSID